MSEGLVNVPSNFEGSNFYLAGQKIQEGDCIPLPTEVTSHDYELALNNSNWDFFHRLYLGVLQCANSRCWGQKPLQKSE